MPSADPLTMAWLMVSYTLPIAGGTYKVFYSNGPLNTHPRHVRIGDLYAHRHHDRLDIWVRVNDSRWARADVGKKHPLLPSHTLVLDDDNLPAWAPGKRDQAAVTVRCILVVFLFLFFAMALDLFYQFMPYPYAQFNFLRKIQSV